MVSSGKTDFGNTYVPKWAFLFGTTLLWLIICEVIIMKLLTLVDFSQNTETVLDALLLVLLVGPVFYALIFRNIAMQRKNTEARMRLQSMALDAAFSGILITEKHGVILWANPAFSQMTGYALNEVLGKTPRILKSGEQPVQVYKELWSTILSGKAWSGELINRRKDGSLYFEKQTIAPVKDKRGAATHFIAVKQDVSADKKLEAQFRQAQKMEAVGRLAGGIAHDFNNLLTIILGQSELLLNTLPPDSAGRDSLQEINQAGKRAASLTRQLLAFSRKQIFQLKVIDLNEIVLGADKMIRRLLGEDVELVTLLGNGLKPIRTDPAQIEQVLMNLAVNARDAMPNGGKLTIETSEVAVNENMASAYPGLVPSRYILLKMQDSGCGIPPEVKSHLFEPFFTTKGPGKGTGLGLATIYGIVKQGRGYIYAESEVGKGAAFLIFLPPSEETRQKEIDAVKPVPSKGDEVILIAEDEELVRNLDVRVLTQQGYRVIEARTGLEALRAAETHEGLPIRLLLTDMIMPQMGGGELASIFSEKYPDAKIIFTSGYSDHSVVQKWLDKGCRFLQKPYTHAELLLIVREVFDKK